MSNIKITQKDNTKYLSETFRTPKNFEDCVKTLRFEDCVMCQYRASRGTSWKGCKQRVRMFLLEGGNIL